MTFDEMIAELERVLPQGHRVHAIPDRTFVAVFSGKTWLGNLHPRRKGLSVQPAYSPWGSPTESVPEALCFLLGVDI